MARFWGVFQHEFNMSIRRKGLWIAYGLLFLFYSVILLIPAPLGELEELEIITNRELWRYAARFILMFNLFLPVAGGILAADRLQRDFHQGVRELQESTPLSRPVYILAKYFGVLAAALLPILSWLALITIWMTARGDAPPGMLYAMPVAFLAITVPAFAFVTAFSLACPLVMPLRVYQILFTGYWFWGNFLNPEAFPTLNGTLLTAGGTIAVHGFFGGFPENIGVPLEYNATDATLNLLVLGACIAAVLVVLDRYLTWQSRRA